MNIVLLTNGSTTVNQWVKQRPLYWKCQSTALEVSDLELSACSCYWLWPFSSTAWKPWDRIMNCRYDAFSISWYVLKILSARDWLLIIKSLYCQLCRLQRGELSTRWCPEKARGQSNFFSSRPALEKFYLLKLIPTVGRKTDRLPQVWHLLDACTQRSWDWLQELGRWGSEQASETWGPCTAVFLVIILSP